MATLEAHQAFASALTDVQKIVNIQLTAEALTQMKQSNYKLCFAKKVGNSAYNVVWQSYKDYLMFNEFSWTPQYQLFGSNSFRSDIKVRVSTNLVNIGLGETSILADTGLLGQPFTGGPDIAFTMQNDFGPIHPGVNQLSTGIDGKEVSTPIYVATSQAVEGNITLTPVEKVLVWFEQDIETSTMFSNARSRSVEIDLTTVNEATRLYNGSTWSTPS